MPNDKSYDLDEIIRFLKKGDYSIFDFSDFYNDYSENNAVVDMEGTGCLYICNVSDNSIPEETVIQVIDVLEHLDECIEQAYDWLTSHEFGVRRFGKEKESIRDIIKKRYTVSEICFRLDDWPTDVDVIEEYCLGPEPPKGADVFSIEFSHRDCYSGFLFKFLCEDRRPYKFIIYIL